MQMLTKLCDTLSVLSYTGRGTAASKTKLVPIFADGECRVVSATDPHGRVLAF
jgi:hypothetical protein